jgi:hypothetical protein
MSRCFGHRSSSCLAGNVWSRQTERGYTRGNSATACRLRDSAVQALNDVGETPGGSEFAWAYACVALDEVPESCVRRK